MNCFLLSLLGLETQLGPVVAAISKNKSIKKLNIGRNLNNIKSKHVYHVMEAVVQMIQVRRAEAVQVWAVPEG